MAKKNREASASSKEESNSLSIVNQAEATSPRNEIISRLKGAAPTNVERDEPSESDETKVGVIGLIDPSTVTIGMRLRTVGDADPSMDASIRANGQYTPILVRKSDMLLVNGLRRLESCKRLGRKVLAHIVDIEDIVTAQIEEDRCRAPLSPHGMYLATEALRPLIEDEAWRRKRLGKKADAAHKKGRTEDFLADHVGISRTNLRKIRAICEAWEADKEKYGEVMEQLQNVGRVDRHYKDFLRLQKEPYSGVKLKTLVIHPDWQVLEARQDGAALSMLGALSPTDLMDEGGIALIPTEVGSLPKATAALRKLGATWKHALPGRTPEESVWLVGVFAKTNTISDEALKAISDACDEGLPALTEYVNAAYQEAALVLNVAENIPAA
jgi:ParB-like chromosome segregation protein Spo0J